ncbi:hypothetical protein HLH33_18610 [Gluconacetobacter diazotrophicus]|uniref:Uncharacterized protein n=1 Tax=Gluconacetobacter diazotrophicus TaxID=33996 RepID=A0A7W4NIC5_GLUDI|nr:hypothetical protein [Gluconacetobacter diazotrophicus]MBB2158277.1 hypothetical protein [Gluconacetobacter diazotrophicus]
MTPAELEDTISRLRGKSRAHAMMVTAMLVAMPTAQRVEAVAILRKLQHDREFLSSLPLPMEVEIAVEATTDEIKRMLANVDAVCLLISAEI